MPDPTGNSLPEIPAGTRGTKWFYMAGWGELVLPPEIPTGTRGTKWRAV